jgi:TP901 family phage tail tape measure protein
MAAITLDVGANTRRAEREIQRLVSRSYNINLRTRGDQPLGRITGKVNEFTKSLDASNARVIAFGASAGIIFGLQRAFSELLRSTVEVQKSLQDINVILNVSTQQLNKFGSELFNIAKNTGQSFQEVAKAATEFSRQGLGLEETLKRTNEALILSRLSGLDTTKSVEALTAAVNSFASQAVTATEVVNKFANVDAAFAVSSADLAEALQRVGSSAAQSGVSLNELIAIVTSAQQTTARGGAVIGNSFKTIFTRLQRGKVVNLLSSLGISETDESGQLKSTIQLLQDLGKIYDTLGARQQAAVAEQVGGVFQINILKAALADLGKEYSIYSSALNVASNSTDQAIRRNEELNKTYAAQVNALKENARELAAAGGQRLFGPSIDRLVGGTNTLLDGFKESDGQNVGAILGKGILDGIGQFIAGPGLALIGGVLLKLFRDLGKFATGSFSQLLGLNTAATQQRDLQQSISQILANNPKLLELALKSNQGLNQAANTLLASLQRQTAELQKQSAVAAQISKAFFGAGVRVSGGIPVAPTGRVGKAAGYIPNFANLSSGITTGDAMAEVIGAANNNYKIQPKDVYKTRIYDGQGGSFLSNVNKKEKVTTKTIDGVKGTFVVPPTGFAAKGFIPNFAPKVQNIDLSTIPSLKRATSRFGVLYPQGGDGIKSFSQPFNTLAGLRGRTDVPGSASIRLPFKSIYPITKQENSSVEDIFDKSTDTFLSGGMTNLARDIANTINQQSKGKVKAKENRIDAKSLPRATKGIIFETAVKGATRDLRVSAKEGDQEAFDFDPISAYPALQGLFGFTGKGNSAVEAKIGETAAKNIPNKILNQYPAARQELIKRLGVTSAQNISTKLTNKEQKQYQELKKQNPELSKKEVIKIIRGGRAAGYIPNFAAIEAPLQEAINAELAAGAPPETIRVDQSNQLKSSKNEAGLAVWSTPFEKSLSQGISMARKSGSNPQKNGLKNRASGYIPNFAIEDPDIQGASAGAGAAAIIAQLGGVAFAFAFTGDQYKISLNELIEKNKEAGRVTGRWTQAQKAATLNLVNAGKITQEEADKRKDAAKFGGSGGQKTGAFLKANAFGIAAAAPILGETIKNVLGQESPGARKTGAVASAAGQIGSFAATGALIAPGPIGAGVGAAIGALLTIPNLVNELTTSLPELAMAAQKASQDLTKFGDVGQRLLTSSSELSKLMTEGGSQEAISKAQDVYAKALSELSDVDRQRLSSAARVGKLEEEYAKVLQEKVEETRATERFVRLQQAEETKDLGVFAGGFDTNPETRQGRANAELLENTFKDFFTTSTALPQNLKDQVKAGKLTEQEAIQQNFQQQKEAGLPAFGNLLQKTLKEGSSVFGVPQSRQKELENILQNVLPESKTKAEDINQLLNLADDGGEAFLNVLTSLIKALDEGPEALQKALEAAKLDAEANKARTEALKKSSDAINATISTIQKNIAVQNLLAQTLDVTAESFRSIAADINIAKQFTQPADALEQVIGSDKAPSRSLRAQSDIALIQENLRSGISSAGIDLKDNIRSIFQKPFQEQRDKLTEELSKTNVTGTPADIETKTAEIIDQYKPLFEQNDQANQNLEKYLSDFINGQTSQEQLLESLRTEMVNVGIDITKNTPILNEVELAIASFGAKTIQEQTKAFQQRAKLASETKQAILQSRIQAALGTFGGFEGFMGRPDEQENYIQKITPDLERIEEIRGSPTFRYNNKESRNEQRKQSPELGRAFANVYKELIGQSGGAFRNVIQKSIDRGLQQTGVESRSGKAGASSLGGFDDIVQGRAADIEQQLQLAKDQLKVTTDPVLKRDLEGFINEIEDLGIDRIAKLQTMQEFGVARQSDFQEIYGEFENQSLERLKEISPELAASLSEAVTFGDPLLAESQVQSGLQTKILETINRAISESGGETGMTTPIDLEAYANEKDPAKRAAMKAGYLSSGVTPIDLEAYANEKDPAKRAAMKNQYLNAVQPVDMTKVKADKKAAEVQKQALPKDNRTIAEIEAETTAKRDQKYLQSPLAPLNRTTGKKFESIQQVDAEMQKALAFGAINPEQKEYYNVLKNFKQNLNPTGGASGRRAMFMYDEVNPQITQPRINQALEANQKTPVAIKSDKEKYEELNRPGQIFKSFDDVLKNWTQRDAFQRTGKIPDFEMKTSKPVTQGVKQESFTQQEAAFNNNTSALTSLAGGIESLNSTLSNFEANFANLNNVPGAQPVGTQGQAGTQPNITTTTNAPVNVVVNAEGGGDIATAVGAEIEKAIPTIINKVRIALGPPFNKVPPQAPKP